MNIKPEQKYMINPAYTLLPDKHCAFIANSKGTGSFSQPERADGNFLQMTAPLYAIMFAYWDGKLSYAETLSKIAEETGMDSEAIATFLAPCFENSEKNLMEYKEKLPDGTVLRNWIPPYFIISAENRVREDLQPPQAFLIPKKDWDFKQSRSYFPHQLNLMLTNRCVTNCIYCYADKKHQIENPLSADKWISIIEEADRIGTLSIDISGGEVFLFPGVERILQCLYQHGYAPYISTKIPLSEERILRLKAAGLKELQVSIDAWDAQTLKKLLQVPESYFEQLKQTLELLEKHQIHVKVKSVITRFNDSLASIENLLRHLTAYGNITEISLAPAEFSIYKKMEGFLQYRTTLAQWKRIEEFRENFVAKYRGNCEISCQEPADFHESTAPIDIKRENFAKRARCTGNINGFYVLADGKVGICEELYWDPRFIIGNLRTQSIMEVWESEKARSLYQLSQNQIRKESTCHRCAEFYSCHRQNGVCWKLVVEAYGNENWDYPDPRCPAAPPIINYCYIQ